MAIRKVVRIPLLALSGIFALALVIIGIALGIIFSPGKITPIANRIIDSLFIVPHRLDKVELTMEGTFPGLGLKVRNLNIGDSTEGSPYDEFLSAPSLILGVDTWKLLSEGSLEVTEVILKDASVNVYIGEGGNSNFLFVKTSPDDEEQGEASEEPISASLPFSIGIGSFRASGLNASLMIASSGIRFNDVQCELDLEGKMSKDIFPIDVNLNRLEACWKDLHFDTEGSVTVDDTISATLPRLSADLGGLHLDGTVNSVAVIPETSCVLPDVDLELNGWSYSDIIALFKSPVWSFLPSLEKTMNGIPSLIPGQLSLETEVSAEIHAGGKICGGSLPEGDIKLCLDRLEGHYGDIPYNLEDGNICLEAHADLTDLHKSTVEIKDFHGLVTSGHFPELRGSNSIKAQGRLTDLFPDGSFSSFNPLVDINVNAKANLKEATPYIGSILDTTAHIIPDVIYKILHGMGPGSAAAQRVKASMEDGSAFEGTTGVDGRLALSMHSTSRLDAWTGLELDDIKGSALVRIEDINAVFSNEYKGYIDRIDLVMHAPMTLEARQKLEELTPSDDESYREYAYNLTLGDILLDSPELIMSIPGGELEIMEAYNISGRKKGLKDDVMQGLYGIVLNSLEMRTGDGDCFSIDHPSGKIFHNPIVTDSRHDRWCYDICVDNIVYSYLEKICSSIGQVHVALAETDTGSDSNYIIKWDPVLKIDIHDLYNDTNYNGDTLRIDMPHLSITVKDEVASIIESRIIIGRSDFSLTGNICNFGRWREKKDNLRAHLKFQSELTDVDELLSLSSGLTNYLRDYGFVASKEEDKKQAKTQEDTARSPIKVTIPTDVDIALEAHIDKARVLRQDANSLNANMYIQDGTVYMDDVGFECDAAKMNFTGLLHAPDNGSGQAPDSTHLGFGFRMRDVDIVKVVDIIPKVDTLMPMLRTFAGKVNLDLAYEASYDSGYYVIPNTLNAAMSIDGKDLVLVPSDLYNKIANFLLVKRDDNLIESLNVDAVWKGDSILVYPFLLKLSKCLIGVDGTNMIDREGKLTGVDYHIAMIRPLPVGVQLTGPLDKLGIELAAPKYKDDFKPVKHMDADLKNTTIEQDIDNAISILMSVFK